MLCKSLFLCRRLQTSTQYCVRGNGERTQRLVRIWRRDSFVINVCVYMYCRIVVVVQSLTSDAGQPGDTVSRPPVARRSKTGSPSCMPRKAPRRTTASPSLSTLDNSPDSPFPTPPDLLPSHSQPALTLRKPPANPSPPLRFLFPLNSNELWP